jgi:hypothetical protein
MFILKLLKELLPVLDRTSGLGTGIDLSTGVLVDLKELVGQMQPPGTSFANIGNGWYRVTVVIPVGNW